MPLLKVHEVAQLHKWQFTVSQIMKYATLGKYRAILGPH